MSETRIMVTGAGGQVGRCLAAQAALSGHKSVPAGLSPVRTRPAALRAGR